MSQRATVDDLAKRMPREHVEELLGVLRSRLDFAASHRGDCRAHLVVVCSNGLYVATEWDPDVAGGRGRRLLGHRAED